MRRKSTRNTTKTPDKPKQAEPAAKKGRRSSRRRRKSTSSESEKSEDEHDVQMDVTQGEEAQTESDRDESPERKTRGGRKRKSDVKAVSKRRGTPDVANEEGATLKGKSKGKNKSKVGKGDHATEYESETCKESEISANAQVTPQSPETVIDKPVCESAVVVTERAVEDNGDAKPDIDGNDQDSTAKDNDNDQADVENQPAENVDNYPSDVEMKDLSEANTENPQNNSDKGGAEQKSSAETEDKVNEPEITNVDELQSEKDSEKLNNINEEVTTAPAEDVKKIEETQECEPEKTEEVVKPDEPEKTEEAKPESEVVEPEHSEENSNDEPAKAEASNNDDDIPMEDISREEENPAEEEKPTNTEEQETPQENQNGIPEDNEEKDHSREETTEDVAQRSFDDSRPSIEEKQGSEKRDSEEKQDSEEKLDSKEKHEVEEKQDFEEKQNSEESEKSLRKSTKTPEEDTKPEPSSERKRKLRLPQTQQKIKLNRLSSASSESSETRNKRTWGGGLRLFSTTADVDSTVVKIIFPTAQLLEESEVKLESEPKIRKISTADSVDGKRDRRVSMESHGYDRQTSEESSRNESVDQEPDNSNIIAFNRKISIIDDSAKHLKAPPSPAKNPTSDVLFITNLVRPFTLKHLRELLERTGKIKEDGFWTDRIKSKCYVQYETEEEAKETREALHGVNWPSGNSKKLIIDYGTAEEMEKARNPPQPVVEVSKSDKENEEQQKKKSERAESKEEKEPAKEKRQHVREWDVGKEDLHRPKSRGHEHSEKRRHSRRSSSPADDYSSKKRKKVEDQVPQKLMDDLFQKTKATPSIYWQPLTPEEIATKQRQRLERMAEHKKMLAETSRGGRSDFVRGAPYRRKYD